MNVVLLNGSSAETSHTKALLTHIAELFIAGNCETEVVSLLTYALPVNDPKYHEDASKSPNEKVREFSAKVAAADIVVLGTPLYHGSFSGLLKLALDNLDDDALAGKRVLIVSNSSGLRNSQQAAHQLVVVARTLEGNVYNRLIGTGKLDYELQGETYSLINPEILDRCQQVVSEILVL